MRRTQFAIVSGAVALVLCVAAVPGIFIVSEDPALIGMALLGLVLLSAGFFSAGLLSFGLLLYRRTTARTRRHARRITSLRDVQSYS